MKALLTLLPILAIPIGALAGNPHLTEIRPYGQINPSDLDLKTCSFDPGADAEVLEHSYHFSFLSNGDRTQIREDQLVRIKVFNARGAGEADVKIPILDYQSENKMEGLEGETFNRDAGGSITITRMDHKQIYAQTANKYFGVYAFNLPDVKAGSIFEYQYTTYSDFGGNIPTVYFQEELPVRYSCIDFIIPKIFVIRDFPHTQGPLVLDTTLSVDNALDDYNIKVSGTEQIWAMKEVSPYRKEAFVTKEKSAYDHLDMDMLAVRVNGVNSRVFPSWEDVSTFILKNPLFGDQIGKNIDGTGDFLEAVKKILDTLQRMIRVYDQVRSTLTWNGSYVYYAGDNINKVWATKTGTSGDINLILVNLLQKAKIRAIPMLATTRGYGLPQLYYPSQQDFNTTIVLVWIGDHIYLLDATKKNLPCNLYPPDLLNMQGYAISDGFRQWANIEDDDHPYKNQVSIIASVTPDGAMQGSALIRSFGYSRVERLEKLGEGQDQFNKTYLDPDGSGINLGSVKITDQDHDSLPLTQSVQFSLPGNASGDFLYFGFNLFSGLSENPFQTHERESDVDFGWTQNYSLIANILLPKGYQVAQLPKNISLMLPDSTMAFTRFFASQDSLVYVRFTFKTSESRYPLTQFPYLDHFYDKLYSSLNEKILIKKEE